MRRQRKSFYWRFCWGNLKLQMTKTFQFF